MQQTSKPDPKSEQWFTSINVKELCLGKLLNVGAVNISFIECGCCEYTLNHTPNHTTT
jgi:hypothetical protein